MIRLLFKMVLLSALVASAYVWMSRYVYGDVIYIQNYKLKRLRQGEGFEAIIFGDSVALGMHWPGHRNLYNYSLAYLGGIYPYRYLLQEYLRFNRAPKVLVLAATPTTFTETERIGLDSRAVLLVPWRLILREIWTRHEWSALPGIIKKRFNLHDSVSAWLGGQLFSQLLDNETGALIPYVEPQFIFHPGAKREFVMSNFSHQQLEGLLDDAQLNGILVVLYFVPASRHVYEWDRAYYEHFEASLLRLAQAHPSVVVCKPYPEHCLWPDEFFLDSIHLNNKGMRRWEKECFPSFFSVSSDGRAYFSE